MSKKAGRPPFEPTLEQRKIVESLASYGIEHDDICLLIINPQTKKPISPHTLRKFCRFELDTGMVKANARVGQSLFEQAVGAPAVYDEKDRKIRAEIPRNVAAAIFWAKTRMGWKETSVQEMNGQNGAPISIVISKNQAAY